VDDGESWFGVRCVFRWRPPGQRADRLYEERITVWRARDFDEAIAKAEADAADYVSRGGDPGASKYLGFAQAYLVGDDVSLEEGVEVFSLLRRSPLKRRAYLDRFFTTGAELEGVSDES